MRCKSSVFKWNLRPASVKPEHLVPAQGFIEHCVPLQMADSEFKYWSALADDFRTLLMSDEGYESVFQQFMA